MSQVAVIGAGTMGTGIVAALLAVGAHVQVVEPDAGASTHLRASLAGHEHLEVAPSADELGAVDLVIEAVPRSSG